MRIGSAPGGVARRMEGKEGYRWVVKGGLYFLKRSHGC